MGSVSAQGSKPELVCGEDSEEVDRGTSFFLQR